VAGTGTLAESAAGTLHVTSPIQTCPARQRARVWPPFYSPPFPLAAMSFMLNEGSAVGTLHYGFGLRATPGIRASLATRRDWVARLAAASPVHVRKWCVSAHQRRTPHSV